MSHLAEGLVWVGSGRPRKSVAGHEASFARTVARAVRCRIRPASGHSIRAEESCLIGHCGHPRKRQSGIPSWSPSGLAGQSTQRSSRVSSYASLSG